ncbi:ElaB/YqjD/DUF883 family membrane-anchored ribosome-binding protein [Clostridium algifaecis]|uniref:ElaB/YqjD/DUF883 family membrane-anchored ribosome-binding protein n=1 Tax=Clostridium algifaecis TaxID=1472040 RepID=A0ABS4KQU8_9CLOT|nr:hypothetical protein [Clostridium algifaecis]MBP2032415.1 ElaB/YqjD/DUF883 family membrane-anchored ribosome-binding protein [Clostridium algifaecis]
MAGIWNINSTYNVNNKRIATKLSFEIGEKFLARVINIDRVSQSILLKLLDGWQFSANIENPEKVLQDELLRFQVDGFEDGKVKLKIVSGEKDSSGTYKDAVQLFIKEKGLNLNSEDYGLIENMIKHDIPLTDENISDIKTLMKFMEKLQSNPKEKDVFIQKYLLSKNIETNSNEGKMITNTLKNFFDKLGDVNSKDIFTLIENNIDLNKANIDSFENVFKKSSTIYNEIKNMGSELNKNIADSIKSGNILESGNDYTDILQKNIEKTFGDGGKSEVAAVKNNTDDNPNINEDINQKDIEDSGVKNNSKTQAKNEISEVVKNILDNSATKDGIKNIAKEIGKQTNSKAEDVENIIKKVINEENNISNNDEKTVVENQDLNVNNEDNKQNVKNNISNIIKDIFSNSTLKAKQYRISKDTIDNITNQIKDQINSKTEEMTDIIKQAISQTDDKSAQKSVNIMNMLNNNINDFKIFNTVSNSYYYMDLPLKFENRDYGCKLIIKDERKKGKKIDSSNVKIATSVNTDNMGVVDAYLTVKNRNMDIDIKSDKMWVNVLKKYDKKILESLSELGYNINVQFNEKKQEMNISNCRDFFQDSEFGIINTRA